MKTKLGVSAGIVVAIAYLAGFFSGLLALIVITGYVFICEQNDWLRVNVMKALLIALFFSFLTSVIGLIPDCVNFLDDMFNLWDAYVSASFLSKLVSFLRTTINLVEKVLTLALALLALKQKTIKIGFIDKITDKLAA